MEAQKNILSTLKDIFSGEEFEYSNTILVVGCGVSIDSNLLDGKSYTNKLLKFYHLEDKLPKWIESINDEYIKDITDGTAVQLYSFPRLESVLNTLQNSLSEDQYKSFLLGTLYGSENVYSNLYHKLIADYLHSGGTVLTFNFDNLIEAAYRELYPKEQMDNICIFPMDTETIPQNKGLLIKAHGCLSQPGKIGMTLNNLFIGGFPESSPERKTLDKMFHQGIKYVVSLGYSYSDSIDFTPYLKEKGKDFKYIHFQHESANRGAFRCVSLKGIEPKNTYKYVLDSILDSGSGKADVVFFNKQCFINQFGSEWTGSIDVNSNTDSMLSFPFEDSPEYSLACLNLIYEYGLSEYKPFREDIYWMEQMVIHRQRVLYSRQVPYAKRLSTFSRYLNRDLHHYFKHFLLFFCNIFSFKRTLLRRIAVFQGTIVELIFTANKRRPVDAEPEPNAVHVLKTCRNLIFGIPLLLLTETMLCIGLGIGKLIGFDRWCTSHNPPLDDYLVAYRRCYQPFYALTEKLRYNAGLYIPQWIVRILHRRIDKCLGLASDLRNMNEYRYIRKEEMILKMLPKGDKDAEGIIRDFNELILFDADTNYFIEVRNVSRKKKLTRELLNNEKTNHC